jgi:hypothetical protein
MASSHSPDRRAVAFDDTRAVANAGLVLPAEALTRLRALPWCPPQHATAARRA